MIVIDACKFSFQVFARAFIKILNFFLFMKTITRFKYNLRIAIDKHLRLMKLNLSSIIWSIIKK